MRDFHDMGMMCCSYLILWCITNDYGFGEKGIVDKSTISRRYGAYT